jgi:hypothetical protein
LTCDYLGRKWAIVITTIMIVVGGILATASNGYTISGMFWMMTVARGTIGFGTLPPLLFPFSPFNYPKAKWKRHRRRIPSIIGLGLRSRQRTRPQTARSNIHPRHEPSLIVRRAICGHCVSDCVFGMSSSPLQYGMARLFRDWLYLAIVRILFSDSNVELGAVSSRGN